MLNESQILDALFTDNTKSSILDSHNGFFDVCFIILHPFYSHPFRNNFDFLENYKDTHHLVKRLTWAEIIKRTGIKSISKLALTITYNLHESDLRKTVQQDYNELISSIKEYEFILENKIELPYYEEDKLPEDITVIFLNFLQKQGYSNIQLGLDAIDKKTKLVKLDGDIYELAANKKNFNYKFIASPDYKFCIKVPYHDLPFTLLLANADKKIIDSLNYEGFYADNTTTLYWFT